MNLSYRSRLLLMLLLLGLFLVGLAIENTTSEALGIAICAVAFVLSAVVVFRIRTGR
jgi:hypothetical protein